MAKPAVVTCVAMILLLPPNAARSEDSPRVTRDLLVLYTFDAEDGNVVRDRSSFGEPLNLEIENREAVVRRDGQLVVRSSARIVSDGPARKVIDFVKRSGEITVEAWIRSSSDKQSGPARIVTLSANPNERNFTLGQDGDRYEARLRASSTSGNGIPAIASSARTATTELAHVVYARQSDGDARIFVNGRQVASGKVAGNLSNWSDSFRLSLGNELSGDRPWLGRIDLVAIYGRALNAGEIRRNHAAGAGAGTEQDSTAVSEAADGAARAGGGLVAMYTFDEGEGNVVRDRSGVEPGLDLRIEDESAVRWSEGALLVTSSAKIVSPPAARISDAVKRTGSVTIEAWVKPSDDDQSGPARIVSLSADTGQRNFTLGQDGSRYDVRFRTSSTDGNGNPSLATPDGAAARSLKHVVYTRDASGTAVVYVDGARQASRQVDGNLANWDTRFPLSVANEVTRDRPWLGELHLVAIYARALSAAEVRRNHEAGPSAEVASGPLAADARQQRLFEREIAPLLARNCLECHDSAGKKGGLDLSRKGPALAGGESGKVIVPGKSSDSILWQLVEAGEMPPEEGDPLSEADRKRMRRWIDDGAVWSREVIDPAVYAHQPGEVRNFVRRMTVPEYIETVKGAVGVDIGDEARKLLPPDVRADGFSNTAYNLNVDLGHVEAYARLAEIVVSRMDVTKFASRFSRSRSLSTDATMRDFVEAMGKWLLRGPLDEREVTNYSGIATSVASAGGDYEEAVGLTIEAMLQSPRFIYRVENQRGDGTPWPVGPYELASRLSYTIWGGPPDEELMKAADSGALLDRDRVEAQAKRMLGDPRAVRRSLQFADQWLHLDRLDNLRPDRGKFPDWDASLAADMREETLAFFEDVVWKRKRPLAELFNAQVTFVTPRLARHYGLDARGAGGSGDADDESSARRYDLSKVPSRGGLLTQGSVLTVGGDEASMVTRGLFVLHDVLRGVVKDPPPGVDTTPVPSKPGLSQRTVAQRRIKDEACGACHGRFEPLAFGLEKFDGLGTFREKDAHGNQLREDGEILFPGAAEPVKYQSAAQLMDLLAGSDRVAETITWKVTQFALGRPLHAADAAVVEQVHQDAVRRGGTYADLIVAVVTSDLVMKTRTEGP